MEARKPQRRIGLFGGTFDPVHRAHLAVARAAVDQLSLDELWWIPAGDPWQKRSLRPVTSAEHRAAMVEAAIGGEPKQRVERCELEREGPSYTVDTIERLSLRHPDIHWVLVMGHDQWCNLPTWHRWREVVDLVEIAVAPRTALPAPSGPAGDSTPDPANRGEPAALAGVPHRRLDMPLLDVSSTALRQQSGLAEDERRHAHQAVSHHSTATQDDLPEVVARYIATHGLYREAP
jgi:nicotinate-nucleotide adenylyltransferase